MDLDATDFDIMGIESLGEKIILTRKTFGLNQLELASLSHLTNKTLRKVERGEFDNGIFNDTPRKVCYALYEYSKNGSTSAKFWGAPSWLKDYIRSTLPSEFCAAVLETSVDAQTAEVVEKLNDISDKLDAIILRLKFIHKDMT